MTDVYRGENWKLKELRDMFGGSAQDYSHIRTQKAHGIRELLARGCHSARYLWSRPGDGLVHIQMPTFGGDDRYVSALSKGWKVANKEAVSCQSPWPDFAPIWLIQSLEDLKQIPSHEFPLFARPCPRVPRHGFVESRKVQTWEDAAKVFLEAQAADVGAEMLLSWVEYCDFSAVANSAGVTFGCGNDGVTAGKGQHHYFIPSNSSLSTWKSALRKADICRIDTHEDIYLEAVESFPRLRLVQARTGPVVKHGSPVISQHAKVSVSHIVQVREDFVFDVGQTHSTMPTDADPRTEEFLDKLRNQHFNGLVVWARGVSPASHIVVQAICRNISVVFADVSPVLGKSLTETYKLDAKSANQKPLLKSTDFLRGIMDTLPQALFAGIQVPNGTSLIDTLAEWAALSLAGIHNISALAAYPASGLNSNQKYALGRLYAVSMAASVFVPLIGVMGEARYWKTHNHGCADSDFPLHHMLRGRTNKRNVVWEAALNLPLPDFIRYSIAATKDFTKTGWSSSYGGPKWAEAGFQALELFETLNQLIEGKRPLETVTDQWNRAVMAAHNGGKVVDKFLAHNVMEAVVSQPTLGFLTNLCGKVLVQSKHHAHLYKLDYVDREPMQATIKEARELWLAERTSVQCRVEAALDRRAESSSDDEEDTYRGEEE